MCERIILKYISEIQREVVKWSNVSRNSVQPQFLFNKFGNEVSGSVNYVISWSYERELTFREDCTVVSPPRQ